MRARGGVRHWQAVSWTSAVFSCVNLQVQDCHCATWRYCSEACQPVTATQCQGLKHFKVQTLLKVQHRSIGLSRKVSFNRWGME